MSDCSWFYNFVPLHSMDEFIFPKRAKKNRKKASSVTSLTFRDKFERELASLLEDSVWLGTIIETIQNAIESRDWEESPSILCLGLGSPSVSRASRMQLSLLHEICNRLNMPSSAVSLYEPVFTPDDITGLQQLGFEAKGDEEARSAIHILSSPTILFMPHCDAELYQSILQLNQEGINRLIFVGNQLEDYLLQYDTSRLEENYPTLKSIVSCSAWRSYPFTPASCDDKAFVALATQYHVNDEGSLCTCLPNRRCV